MWWLVACTLVLTGTYAVLYGVLGGFRNAPTAQERISAYPITFGLYLLAVWLVCRARRHPRQERHNLWVILLGAIAFRATVLGGVVPPNPDLGRHLWEGKVLLEGYNPYAAAPADSTYDALKAQLSARGDDLYSGGWLRFARVRSVYGPVATALFAIPHLLPVDRVFALRLLMSCFDILTVLALVTLARAVGRPPTWVVVYAWSPVCINGFADRGQVDAAMVFLVVAAVVLAQSRRPWMAGVLFAGAILTKVSPLLLLLPLLRCCGGRFALAFFATALVGVLPFTGAGVSGLDGFVQFADRWRANDSAFSLLTYALSPLSAWLDPSRVARAGLTVMVGLYAAVHSLRGDPGASRWLVGRAAAICAAVIICSPVTYPWYTALMVAFVCVQPSAPLIGLTLAPMFWYTRFVTGPEGTLWHAVKSLETRWFQPWRAPVYGVVALLFARDALSHKKRSAKVLGDDMPNQ